MHDCLQRELSMFCLTVDGKEIGMVFHGSGVSIMKRS